MITPSLSLEKKHWVKKPSARIAGVDEVGRGCLAGPVVAAAVVFSSSHQHMERIRDSKTLTASKRTKLFSLIKSRALSYSIQFISVKHINTHNILQSSLQAMSFALEKISPLDHILVDGIHIPTSDMYSSNQYTTIKQGDSKCYTIAAASILAKVARDEYMQQLHPQFPHYDWNNNKGYGTAKHRQAIKKHGPTPHHRTKFLRKIGLSNRNSW